MMPFGDIFDEIYQGCIRPSVLTHMERCVRGDDIFHNRPIIEVIWEYINKAAVVIADLTGRNPNVFYEVGIAHTLRKEVILVCQSLADVPFDLRHVAVIEYKYTPPGAEKMKARLAATLSAILKKNAVILCPKSEFRRRSEN